VAEKIVNKKFNDIFTESVDEAFSSLGENAKQAIYLHLHTKFARDCSYQWEGPKWLVPDLTFPKYVILMKLSLEETRRIGEVEVILDADEQQLHQMQ
jgi:hypothetical protein